LPLMCGWPEAFLEISVAKCSAIPKPCHAMLPITTTSRQIKIYHTITTMPMVWKTNLVSEFFTTDMTGMGYSLLISSRASLGVCGCQQSPLWKNLNYPWKCVHQKEIDREKKLSKSLFIVFLLVIRFKSKIKNPHYQSWSLYRPIVHFFSSVAYVWVRGAKTTEPITKRFGVS
jgi:hypothetical protein